MTLEDFFTLTEMKDGLTAPARVEELISVMTKDKDSLVKNIGDTTRQWTAVASTIAATEHKECLELFIQLNGLRFIDKWLNDAQTFSDEPNDLYVEEAMSALLQALQRLQIGREMLISSGIYLTVKNLPSYRSTRIQDKARALLDSWNAEDLDCESMDVEKAAMDKDQQQMNAKSPAAGGLLLTRPLSDLKMAAPEVQIIESKDQGCSEIATDDTDSKHGYPDTVLSPVKLECVESGHSEVAEVYPSESVGQSDLGCSDFLKPDNVSRNAEIDNSGGIIPDKFSKLEVSSACEVSGSADDLTKHGPSGPKETAPDLDVDSGHSGDAVSVKPIDGRNCIVGESSSGIDGIGPVEQKGSALEGNKDLDTSLSKVVPVEELDNSKKHHKKEKKYFGKSCKFVKLAKKNKATNFIGKTPDMDLEDGTVDALEVARLVAMEVERQVGCYNEQSDNSSDSSSSSSSSSYSTSFDERISRGAITEPDCLGSVNEGQEMQAEFRINDLSAMKNVSSTSEKKPLTTPGNPVSKLETYTQDLESSQVTDTVKEQEITTEKSSFEFDLNLEVSSEDLDHQGGFILNPISVDSTSRAALEVPGPSLQFEGTLGWKGSAATSAFRPASPRRGSDSDRVLSGGGTSSSRQRQDFLDIDLNVAEEIDDKNVNPVLGEQKLTSPGYPSGESSVEFSSRKAEGFTFDLNEIGENGDVEATQWRKEGQMFGPRYARRSTSPASSSSCMQPSTRNFDLNDNPSSNNDFFEQQRFLGMPETRTKKSTFPLQTPSVYPNGRAAQPAIDTSLLRGGSFIGLGTSVPYPQSIYSYNGLAVGATVPFSSGSVYGPAGPFPFMFDSRAAPMVQELFSSAAGIPPSHCQPTVVMNMMGVMPVSNNAGPLRPNLDVNLGFGVERGNRDPAFLRQLFIPGQGRASEDHLRRENVRPLTSGIMGGKRKEPDTEWELYPANLRHHQPPHL